MTAAAPLSQHRQSTIRRVIHRAFATEQPPRLPHIIALPLDAISMELDVKKACLHSVPARVMRRRR